MEAVLNEIRIEKYPEYKNSGVDWLRTIPKHWKVLPGLSFMFESKEKNKGMTRSSVLSLSYGKIRVKGEDELTGLVPESFETYQFVNKGDLIFRPTDLQNDVVSLRSSISEFEGIITSAYLNFRFKEKAIPQFFHYFFRAIDNNKVIYGLGSGLRQNISFNDFRRFLFPIPPLEEQTAIAQFLDRKTALIDQAIGIKEKQIGLLKEHRQILIHKAVTRGLNPNVKLKDSGVEWIGEIPEGWEVKRLKMILRNENGALKPGPFGSDLKGGDFVELGYKVYNQRAVLDSDFDISEECITERKYKGLKNFSVKSGDILLTSRGTIGKCSVVPLKYEAGIIHPCIIRLRLNNEIVNNIFIKQYIEWSVAFQASLKLNSNATTIDVIYGNTLSASLFIIPPIKEQSLIAEYIDDEGQKFNKAISFKEQEIEKLKEYKASLINSAVTGKIKVC